MVFNYSGAFPCKRYTTQFTASRCLALLLLSASSFKNSWMSTRHELFPSFRLSLCHRETPTGSIPLHRKESDFVINSLEISYLYPTWGDSVLFLFYIILYVYPLNTLSRDCNVWCSESLNSQYEIVNLISAVWILEELLKTEFVILCFVEQIGFYLVLLWIDCVILSFMGQ